MLFRTFTVLCLPQLKKSRLTMSCRITIFILHILILCIHMYVNKPLLFSHTRFFPCKSQSELYNVWTLAEIIYAALFYELIKLFFFFSWHKKLCFFPFFFNNIYYYLYLKYVATRLSCRVVVLGWYTGEQIIKIVS